MWGQDNVVERVRENVVFLENPEAIEEKGGYVPGGILLWGPPGTGKTLLAEAVAGETGKPYVFVDPGAFINMFFGVGVLKVKGLYRKLRKLSLRYGGVIVFFDEADTLGSRGGAVSQARRAEMMGERTAVGRAARSRVQRHALRVRAEPAVHRRGGPPVASARAVRPDRHQRRRRAWAAAWARCRRCSPRCRG